MKAKRQPIRTCVACRNTDQKRKLMRIVRLPDGSVTFDAKGKLNGRGAYLCTTAQCITVAEKQKRLERSLKSAPITKEFFNLVLQIAEQIELDDAERSTKIAAPGSGIGDSV